MELLPADILLARPPGAARETLYALSGQRDAHIGLAMIEHQDLDGEILDRLADAVRRSSPDGAKLAAAIARHPAVRPQTLLKLSGRTTDPDAIDAIIDHPETRPHALDLLTRRLSLGRAGTLEHLRRLHLALRLARDPRLSPDTLDRLIALRHVGVIQAVIDHPNIRADTQIAGLTRLMRLAGREHRIALQVARHPATPDRILHRLAMSDEENILHAIAQNPSTAPRTLHALVRRMPLPDGRHGGTHHTRTATLRVGTRVAGHPALRKKTVRLLLSMQESTIDRAVLNRGDTDPDILERLAQTHSTDVGRALLGTQRNLPDRALISLAETAVRHPPNHLAETLASHPRTTPAILRHLADLYQKRGEDEHATHYRHRVREMEEARAPQSLEIAP